jgi:beta-glucosidase
MTFIEKGWLVGGHIPSITWTGATSGIRRLKVPIVRYADGPQGFRMNIRKGTTTAWPSVLSYSNSWDIDLVREWGETMGKEFKDKGAGIQLGPGMNVMRIGLDGRDFEYISGEDPTLGAELVAPLIEGIQSNGIMANMKHFINNN